jgi:16S rRNA (guanine527-N7)-methyltransferase
LQRADQLAAGLRELGFELAVSAQAKALDYLTLLEKWNRVYNLTGVRDAHEMVTRHLLDSFAIIPFVAGLRVLDIGTGAGLPGIPLALALPNMEFVLLDSGSKKIQFVRHVVTELALHNVSVVCQRAQQYAPAVRFDTVITRALASIKEVSTMACPLCTRAGRVLIMKGVFPTEELAEIPDGYNIVQVVRLRVPGLKAKRHLVHIEARR